MTSWHVVKILKILKNSRRLWIPHPEICLDAFFLTQNLNTEGNRRVSEKKTVSKFKDL